MRIIIKHIVCLLLLIIASSKMVVLGQEIMTPFEAKKTLQGFLEKEVIDQLYAQKFYHVAIQEYEKLLLSSSNFDSLDVFKKLGESYFQIRQYDQALIYFEKIEKQSKDEYAVLRLAQIYNILGLDLSTKNTLEYLTKSSNIPVKHYAHNQLDFKKSELKKDFIKDVKTETLLNSNDLSQFSPFPINDSTLYFISNKEVNRKRTIEIGESNIYVSEKHQFILSQYNNGVQEISDVELNIQHKNLAGITLGNDGDLYYSLCEANSCSLYKSDFKKRKIGAPQALKGQFSGNASFKHPYFTYDQKGKGVLLFTSDQEGTLGGWDIWYAFQNEDGSFGKAQNFGNEINTIFDEETPYFDEFQDNLYFCSNGHAGYGGKDLFVVKTIDFTSNGPVLNVGAPLNSSYDDHYFYLSPNGKHGYFSSNRPLNAANSEFDNIFSFELSQAFEYRNIEASFRNKPFWVIDDSDTKWLYFPEEGIQDVALMNHSQESINTYFVGENNEIIFSNIIQGKNGVLSQIPRGQKFKVFTDYKGEIDVDLMVDGQPYLKDGELVYYDDRVRTFQYRKMSVNKQSYQLIDRSEGAFIEKITMFPYKKIKGHTSPFNQIVLIDDKGNFIARAFSDKNGDFTFDHVKSDDVVFVISSKKDGIKVSFTDGVSFVYRELSPEKDPAFFRYADYDGFNQMRLVTNGEDQFVKMGVTNLDIFGNGPKLSMIFLVDEKGNIIKETKSDENGLFKFRNIPANEYFQVHLPEGVEGTFINIDIVNLNGKNVAIIDSKGNPRVFKYGKIFTSEPYTNLSLEDKSVFQLHDNGDNFSLKEYGVSISGKAPAGTVVHLLEIEDGLILKTVANERGEFFFRKLPSDQRFELFTHDQGTFVEATFLDINGQIVKVINSENSKIFKFRHIKDMSAYKEHLNIEDKSNFDVSKSLVEVQKVSSNQSTLKVKQTNLYIEGVSNPNVWVYLVDQGDSLMMLTKSDSLGQFSFKKIPVQKSFNIALSTKDKGSFVSFALKDQFHDTLFYSDNKKEFVEYKNIEQAFSFENLVDAIEENKESNESIQLIDEIRLFCSFVRSSDYYYKFIARYGDKQEAAFSYSVQVLGIKDYPKSFISNLKENGFEQIVSEKNNHGLYVVLVGKKYTIGEAEILRKELVDFGLKDAYIAVYMNGERQYSLILQK